MLVRNHRMGRATQLLNTKDTNRGTQVIAILFRRTQFWTKPMVKQYTCRQGQTYDRFEMFLSIWSSIHYDLLCAINLQINCLLRSCCIFILLFLCFQNKGVVINNNLCSIFYFCSVENSEYLSDLLRARNIPHNVLNARPKVFPHFWIYHNHIIQIFHLKYIIAEFFCLYLCLML